MALSIPCHRLWLSRLLFLFSWTATSWTKHAKEARAQRGATKRPSLVSCFFFGNLTKLHDSLHQLFLYKNTCKTHYITLQIVSSRFPQVFPIFSRLSLSKFSIKTNDQCDWVACSVRDGMTFTCEDEVGLFDQRPTMRDKRKEGREMWAWGATYLPSIIVVFVYKHIPKARRSESCVLSNREIESCLNFPFSRQVKGSFDT